MAQLSYSVPVLMGSQKQLDSLFKPLLPILKHTYALAKTAPNNILFLDKVFGGYGIPNLYLRSIAAKMEFITKHVLANDFVGKKLMITTENLQFESGISSNIFCTSNKRARKYITESLLTLVANQLEEFGITLWITMKVQKVPTLMDVALNTMLPDEQLLRLNNSRIYFKFLYWTSDTSYKCWPNREISRQDKIFFETFVQKYKQTSPLKNNVIIPKPQGSMHCLIPSYKSQEICHCTLQQTDH